MAGVHHINGSSKRTHVDQSDGLDLTLSVMALYPFPYMPTILQNQDDIILPFPEEFTRENKRKRNASFEPDSLSSKNSASFIPYSGGGGGGNGGGSSHSGGMSHSGSTHSLNSPAWMQFRDHVWTYSQRYLAAEAVEEVAAALLGGDQESGGSPEDEEANEIRLVQLLIACAEAVASRDKSHASALLSELRANALVFGSSFQRVASCFVQGLADRLSIVTPLGAVGFAVPTMRNQMDYRVGLEKKEEALILVYKICPHIQFGHFVANASILEAFEGESFVHVVDLGLSLGLPHGYQWQDLIRGLASRSGQPPKRLRITAVGLSDNKFRMIGDELELYASSLGVNLEFFVVKSTLENLTTKDIDTSEDEVIVVNSILQLHSVVKECRAALNSVLQTIHELSPKLLVLVEQDSSHNGPFFLGRFMEALHYYSAIFDSLDFMLPKYDIKRAKIEQFYFAEEMQNIISCEGPARVERHERVDQWRRRMNQAGFQAVPRNTAAQARQWLRNMEACEGYTIVEEKGCLVLGWKSRPIVAVSCWKC